MRALVDLVFPHACPGCEAPGHRWLCAACEAAFPWLEHGCARCGRPVQRVVPDCGDCRSLSPAFSAARSAAIYEGVARSALMAFKLGGRRRDAGHLARAMLPIAAPLRADVITFVPSTPRAEAVRGFNPAAEIARSLASGLGLPRLGLLSKVRETRDQAGLTRAQRRLNQRGAFRARLDPDARIHRVLLVDDVLTTGATADACARALRDGGAGDVVVATFARAP